MACSQGWLQCATAASKRSYPLPHLSQCAVISPQQGQEQGTQLRSRALEILGKASQQGQGTRSRLLDPLCLCPPKKCRPRCGSQGPGRGIVTHNSAANPSLQQRTHLPCRTHACAFHRPPASSSRSSQGSGATTPTAAPATTSMKALDACAAYITGALSHHLAETGFNGLSWQQLITQAAEHGLKPKTMRLARCYLRDKAKTLLLYRTKVVGCRETKYLWGLVGHALPEFSEVISHDPEDEVCTLIAAVKAGARTLNSEGIRADRPLPADPSCNDGSSMFRRLSDGVSGSTLAYPPSLSPHHSDAPSAGEPTASGDSRDALCNSQSSRRRFVPYHELEKQFGVGVAKAASNLGICKTTLKRICRQHGIKQWPRRQIAKALSQLAAGDNGSSGTGGANASHQLQVTATPRSMPSAPAHASLPLNQSSNALVVDTPSWAAGPHQHSARLALPAPPPQSSPLPSPYRSSNAFPSGTITKHMQLYGSSTQSHYEPCATQGMGGSAGFRMRPMDAPSARPAGMLGMSSMQQTAAAPSASTSASHAAASLRFLGAAGNASARPSAPRAFTDSMHWQSSCSAAPNPRQVPQSVSLASHGRPMSSAAPMSGSVSGLPWVHLPQFGVSCPVYVMLPDQRL